MDGDGDWSDFHALRKAAPAIARMIGDAFGRPTKFCVDPFYARVKFCVKFDSRSVVYAPANEIMRENKPEMVARLGIAGIENHCNEPVARENR